MLEYILWYKINLPLESYEAKNLYFLRTILRKTR